MPKLPISACTNIFCCSRLPGNIQLFLSSGGEGYNYVPYSLNLFSKFCEFFFFSATNMIVYIFLYRKDFPTDIGDQEWNSLLVY